MLPLLMTRCHGDDTWTFTTPVRFHKEILCDEIPGTVLELDNIDISELDRVASVGSMRLGLVLVATVVFASLEELRIRSGMSSSGRLYL